ncbi:MAG: serine/threonine-protein phosphatase [Phycisphaeraceae bacterium]|nr:serine/threonine-protein phosphatase [Phycisphaeraceae bacterium]
MPTPRVIMAVSPQFGSPWARWCAPLTAAWPGGNRDALRIEQTSFDGLTAWALESSRAEQICSEKGCALVIVSDREPASVIDHVTDALTRAGMPGVILLSDPGPWRDFQRDGIIFDRHDAPASSLAAMLYALAQRQSAFESVRRELRLAQRCGDGIRAQIDRMHEEMYLAASVQREFAGMSGTASVEGLSAASIHRPVNFVSGDVHLLRDLGGGRASFFLADAAGHGVPAALLTMVLTHALTTHHEQSELLLEPSEVMTRLNDRVCRHTHNVGGWFATALYGVIDTHNGTLCVAGAGHPPTILVRQTGGSQAELVELSTEGPVLGLWPGVRFNQVSARLHPDDLLLIYTDGIEEVLPDHPRAEGRWLGRPHMPHFEDLLTIDREEPLPEGAAQPPRPTRIIDQLSRMLDQQCGSMHQRDDITIMALQLSDDPASRAHGSEDAARAAA